MDDKQQSAITLHLILHPFLLPTSLSSFLQPSHVPPSPICVCIHHHQLTHVSSAPRCELDWTGSSQEQSLYSLYLYTSTSFTFFFLPTRSPPSPICVYPPPADSCAVRTGLAVSSQQSTAVSSRGSSLLGGKLSTSTSLPPLLTFCPQPPSSGVALAPLLYTFAHNNWGQFGIFANVGILC